MNTADAARDTSAPKRDYLAALREKQIITITTTAKNKKKKTERERGK